MGPNSNPDLKALSTLRILTVNCCGLENSSDDDDDGTEGDAMLPPKPVVELDMSAKGEHLWLLGLHLLHTQGTIGRAITLPIL